MGRYKRRYNNSSYGREKAAQHIREAKRLSEELGGTDEDVKNYFFSLNPNQLKILLGKYEAKHGASAREYAEETFSKWKGKRRQMSGMVATRLFNLLPPEMPLDAKYQLTESLWKHVGPSSSKIYYIGLDANIDEVHSTIKAHLENVVIHYEIPSSMEKRFNWLSHGDVRIKQKLLNHLRQQEQALLLEAVQTNIPILLDHLRGNEGSLTNHVSHFINVGKHDVKVIVDDRVIGVTEVAPKSATNTRWIWWVIGIGILLLWALIR